jgi:hypothetical protein
MMKKSLTILSILIISFNGYSQTQQFFDSPFGGGGGFTPGWTFTKVNSLNSKLSYVGMPLVTDKGIFTTGGSGFIYVGFVPGLRVGGMGYGGSTSVKSTLQAGSFYLTAFRGGENNTGVGYNTETDYSIGGGGFTVEYTLPFIKSIGVSPGLIIGGGNITIDLYANKGGYFWNGIGNSTEELQNFHKTLKNNFWLIAPTINVDIPFYRFFCFRIGAGYNFTLGEEWKVDNNQSISGVPSDFNGRNFFIQTGIFMGFFSF